MLDVEIRNFQSIEHVHVQIEGFTALVGRSNLGKSAIIRAVKAALTGASTEDFVRHGSSCERLVKGAKNCKCYCSVHLKTEGLDLLWEKGGDKNEYWINGAKKDAVGKGTPEFLEDGFGLVKIGDRKVLLQVADQFRSEGGGPIFLLDEAGSVVADVLSDVAQLDRINVATRLAEKDRKDAASQRKVREKDVVELKVRLSGYDGLDPVLARVQEVEADERKVAHLTTRRDQVARFKEGVLTVGRQVKSLMGISAVVIPDMPGLNVSLAGIGRIAHFQAELRDKEHAISQLEGVDRVVAPPIEGLRTCSSRSVQLAGWLTKLRIYKQLFERLGAAEKVPVPEFQGVQEGAQMAIRIGNLARKHALLDSQVSTLGEQVEEVEREWAAVEAERAALGACPTCARPLDIPHEHAAAE